MANTDIGGAVDLLKAGKTVTRELWTNAQIPRTVALVNGALIQFVPDQPGNFVSYSASADDLLAGDWQEVAQA